MVPVSWVEDTFCHALSPPHTYLVHESVNFLEAYLNVGKLLVTVTDRFIYNILWITLYFRNQDKLRPNTIQFFALLVDFEWKRLYEAC